MTVNQPPADPTLATDKGVEVVRAEEQLRVGTTSRVRERVLLHKRVVTEQQTHTVTVSREVLDIERLPADPTDYPEAAAGTAAPAGEIEIVLHEERVTVTTAVVPVERVRVRVDRVTDHVDVAEVLRREQVEVVSVPPAEGSVPTGVPVTDPTGPAVRP